MGDQDKHLPTNHGFDEFFGNLYHLNAEEEPETYYYPKNPEFHKKFGPRGVIHSYADGRIEDTGPLTRKRMESVDYEFGGAAKDFMERAVKADKPFFVWMNFTRMHVWTRQQEKYKGRTGIGLYADGMVELDDMVGSFLEKIKELGIDDNTIVIFSTDNGTAPAANFRELASKGVDLHNHYKGHKSRIDEGGHRVPLIMRWPGMINAGSQNDETVCLNDFLASFAEMTARKLAAHEGVDSHSIWPLIAKGKKKLSNHPHLVSHSYWGQYSIRDEDWKLIFPLKKNEASVLYDLKNDIKETKNVATDHPERVKKMTAILKGYVENGRSTPGPMQENFESKSKWLGLPW